MQVEKSQFVQALRDQGHDDQADRAERELPEQIDTDQVTGYDVDLREILFKLSGEFDAK